MSISGTSQPVLMSKNIYYGIISVFTITLISIITSILFSIGPDFSSRSGFAIIVTNILLIVNIVLMKKGYVKNMRRYRLKLRSAEKNVEVIDFQSELEKKAQEYKKTYFTQLISIMILMIVFAIVLFVYGSNLHWLIKYGGLTLFFVGITRYSSDPLDVTQGEAYDVFDRSFDSGMAMESTLDVDDNMGP